MVFGSPQKLEEIRDLVIYANAQLLEGVETFKYLGVTVQQNMSWYDHRLVSSSSYASRISSSTKTGKKRIGLARFSSCFKANKSR